MVESGIKHHYHKPFMKCFVFYIYIYIYQTVLELDFRAIFVLPSTGFEPTPLLHCSTIRLALSIDHSTTSIPKKGASIVVVTLSRKENLGIKTCVLAS